VHLYDFSACCRHSWVTKKPDSLAAVAAKTWHIACLEVTA
jgi:hypothetical protein